MVGFSKKLRSTPQATKIFKHYQVCCLFFLYSDSDLEFSLLL